MLTEAYLRNKNSNYLGEFKEFSKRHVTNSNFSSTKYCMEIKNSKLFIAIQWFHLSSFSKQLVKSELKLTQNEYDITKINVIHATDNTEQLFFVLTFKLIFLY